MSFAKCYMIYWGFTPTIIYWKLESQSYIKDFLEKLSSSFGIHLQIKIPTVHTGLPWEVFLIFCDPFTNQNPNRTYRTSLRSFSHLTGLPWEVFLIFCNPFTNQNPNRTYKTSSRSFPHFWDPFTNQIPTIHTGLPWEAFLIFGIHLQIKSQPYIQDFLEKLSSSLGSIYKSDLNRRYKTFLRSFHHLWDRFTN